MARRLSHTASSPSGQLPAGSLLPPEPYRDVRATLDWIAGRSLMKIKPSAAGGISGYCWRLDGLLVNDPERFDF